MKTNLPDSIIELFKRGEESYFLHDHEPIGGSAELVKLFLAHFPNSQTYVEEADGTVIFLRHPDFDFGLRVDLVNLGEASNSRAEVSKFSVNGY